MRRGRRYPNANDPWGVLLGVLVLAEFIFLRYGTRAKYAHWHPVVFWILLAAITIAGVMTGISARRRRR